jgi:hypothetical protein
MKWLVSSLVIGMLGFAGTAWATQAGNGAIVKWKGMDTCARQAQAAFPDFTPASNAKRNAKLNECLNANNLPPRAPLPAQPPNGSADGR